MKLHFPLAPQLDEPSPEALRRVKSGLFTALERPTPKKTPWLIPAVALLSLLGLLALWLSFEREHRSDEPGPLLTRSGQEFAALDGGEQGWREELADGSSLAIGAQGRVTALASTAQEFSILLERGELDVHVKPGGARRWIVEAKWVRVEVVGTRFSVRRWERSASVRVLDGVVLVRSSHLAEGVTRLGAGELLTVTESETPEPDGTKLDSTPALAEAPDPLPSVSMTAEPEAPLSDSMRGALSIERLIERADRARAEGRLNEAERLLDSVIKQHAGDPRAVLAGYGLGVVRFGQAGGARRALAAFEWVLSRKPSRSLREDTLLRLVEVHLALGEVERAQDRGSEYRASFPEGRHLTAIERLLAKVANAP